MLRGEAHLCNKPRKLIRSATASDMDSDQDILTDDEKVYRYTSDGTTIYLTAIQQVVYVNNAVLSILMLPPVADAKGLQYTITIANTGNAITLADYNDDSTSWPGDYTLDTAGDNITLLSNGKSWSVVTNNIA
jgi:hypothetical protein